jgi:hypothetical protein
MDGWIGGHEAKTEENNIKIGHLYMVISLSIIDLIVFSFKAKFGYYITPFNLLINIPKSFVVQVVEWSYLMKPWF